MTGSGTLLGDLAALVGGQVLGNASQQLQGIRPLESAEPGDLSFLHKASFKDRARASRAGAFLVPEKLGLSAETFDRPLLAVADSSLALAQLIRHFHPLEKPAPGVHATAVVGEGCEIAASAHLGPYVVIGDGTRVGEEAVIEAHVTVGRQCQIGDGVWFHPNVVIYDQTVIGDAVEIHAGAVVGSDGFGYATSAGVHHKVPQVGTAVIEQGVEIGANSTVDRALLEETRIGAGSKIDNLVHVGHNVRTGKSCILCGQAGIAGSTQLGNFVVLGGQAGIIDHLEIGDQVQVAAKSAVFQDTASTQQVGGIPAIELSKYRRQAAAAGRLPDIGRRLRRLERRLDQLEDGEGGE